MRLEQLTRTFQDRQLRIEFIDGETNLVLINVVSDCDEHDECRGIVYEIITEAPRQAYWTEMKYIKSFEVIGSDA